MMAVALTILLFVAGYATMALLYMVVGHRRDGD